MSATTNTKRTRQRRAAYQANCPGSAHWHQDDCVGCPKFLSCARQQDGYYAECWCPDCCWLGTWDDCNVRVIRETRLDPEERYALCPQCGQDVEPADEED